MRHVNIVRMLLDAGATARKARSPRTWCECFRLPYGLPDLIVNGNSQQIKGDHHDGPRNGQPAQWCVHVQLAIQRQKGTHKIDEPQESMILFDARNGPAQRNHQRKEPPPPHHKDADRFNRTINDLGFRALREEGAHPDTFGPVAGSAQFLFSIWFFHSGRQNGG